MARKHRFSNAERFAVWDTYDGQCFWCGDPQELKHLTVDHIVPESMLDDPDKLEQVKRLYRLPASFQVDGFENWVPCHGNCNSRKSVELFEASPATISVFSQVGKAAAKAKETCEKVKVSRSKGRILGRLAAAASEGSITRTEILELFDGLEGDVGSPPATFAVGGWTVIRREGEFEVVSNGRVYGVVPTTPDPDPSWTCPTCGSMGPWSGARCLSCGHLSDGD